MYEIFLKCDVKSPWTPPPPCHKLSHLLGPPPPSTITYFMNGPYAICSRVMHNDLYETAPGSVGQGFCASYQGFPRTALSCLLCLLSRATENSRFESDKFP